MIKMQKSTMFRLKHNFQNKNYLFRHLLQVLYQCKTSEKKLIQKTNSVNKMIFLPSLLHFGLSSTVYRIHPAHAFYNLPISYYSKMVNKLSRLPRKFAFLWINNQPGKSERKYFAQNELNSHFAFQQNINSTLLCLRVGDIFNELTWFFENTKE